MALRNKPYRYGIVQYFMKYNEYMLKCIHVACGGQATIILEK